jgi:O-antigen/teichoic acid export membrane protein
MSETNSSASGAHVGRRIAMGAVAGGVVNVIRTLLQLLLLPVMARLLGPAEFGLYALALPTVSLVALLADGGLGGTLAREDESSSLVWSSAFWVLLLMGLALASVSSIFGVLLGYLSHQPRLPGLIALLSLSIVFLTLSVVPTARLTRRKNIGTFAGADIAATLIGTVVAVLSALYGAGAWSLAAQYVVTYAVRSTILNFAAFHFPEARLSLTALRPHLVSGGILVATRMSDYAGRMAESFIIDRIFGVALLGNFTFANQISRYGTETAGNVVWATLYTHALTGDRDKIVFLHRKLCRLLGITLIPAAFLCAAAAPELISVFLGPKWADLTMLLRVFLPLYAMSTICVQSAPILLARGRFEIQLWCTVGLMLGRVLAISLGYWIGLTGTMYGIGIATLAFCAATLIWPAKVTGCDPLPILADLVRPAISTIVATAAFFLLNEKFPMAGAAFLINFAGAFVVYLGCMLVIDRKHLSEDLSSVWRIVVPRRISSSPA